MDIEQYIREEKKWLGEWPKKTEGLQAIQQYYLIATEMLENIRSKSAQQSISLDKHVARVNEAKDLLDTLQSCLCDERHLSSEQMEWVNEQTIWHHKEGNQGGLVGKRQNIWPLNREILINTTRQYLDTPYLQTNSLDYLLTDCLIYAEVSAYKECILSKDKLFGFYGRNWGIFKRTASLLTKWVIIGGALMATYNDSKELFLLLGISVVAYQSTKSIKDKASDNGWGLFSKMVNVYLHCNHKYYQAAVIWEMCSFVREKGAFFDGVMYELLQRQIQKSKT